MNQNNPVNEIDQTSEEIITEIKIEQSQSNVSEKTRLLPSNESKNTENETYIVEVKKQQTSNKIDWWGKYWEASPTFILENKKTYVAQRNSAIGGYFVSPFHKVSLIYYLRLNLIEEGVLNKEREEKFRKKKMVKKEVKEKKGSLLGTIVVMSIVTIFFAVIVLGSFLAYGLIPVYFDGDSIIEIPTSTFLLIMLIIGIVSSVVLGFLLIFNSCLLLGHCCAGISNNSNSNSTFKHGRRTENHYFHVLGYDRYFRKEKQDAMDCHWLQAQDFFFNKRLGIKIDNHQQIETTTRNAFLLLKEILSYDKENLINIEMVVTIIKEITINENYIQRKWELSFKDVKRFLDSLGKGNLQQNSNMGGFPNVGGLNINEISDGINEISQSCNTQ